MRTIALSLCLGLALAAPVSVAAQNAPAHRDGVNKIPQVILDGLDALHRDRPDDAEAAWRRDSALAQGAASGTLRRYKQYDGEYQGFEVVAVQEITQRTRVVYLALNYERQPHFAKFVAYHTDKEWVLLQLDLNVDVTAMETALMYKPQ